MRARGTYCGHATHVVLAPKCRHAFACPPSHSNIMGPTTTCICSLFSPTLPFLSDLQFPISNNNFKICQYSQIS